MITLQICALIGALCLVSMQLELREIRRVLRDRQPAPDRQYMSKSSLTEAQKRAGLDGK